MLIPPVNGLTQPQEKTPPLPISYKIEMQAIFHLENNPLKFDRWNVILFACHVKIVEFPFFHQIFENKFENIYINHVYTVFEVKPNLSWRHSLHCDSHNGFCFNTTIPSNRIDCFPNGHFLDCIQCLFLITYVARFSWHCVSWDIHPVSNATHLDHWSTKTIVDWQFHLSGFPWRK